MRKQRVIYTCTTNKFNNNFSGCNLVFASEVLTAMFNCIHKNSYHKKIIEITVSTILLTEPVNEILLLVDHENKKDKQDLSSCGTMNHSTIPLSFTTNKQYYFNCAGLEKRLQKDILWTYMPYFSLHNFHALTMYSDLCESHKKYKSNRNIELVVLFLTNIYI